MSVKNELLGLELEIYKIIEKRGDRGISSSELGDLLALQVSRRTLQRRLAQLVNDGFLVKRGKGQRLVYALRVASSMDGYIADNNARQSEYGVENLYLGSAALQVKNYVAQPIIKRKNVGYNRKFLDEYQPNKTFYLSMKVRKHLHEIGRLVEVEPFIGTYGRDIFNRLLIDLAWNSSRLEGNTYSLLETERLLVDGKISAAKTVLETQMILNHKSAIEFLLESAEYLDFNRTTILNLHALLSENLLGNPEACGSLRAIPVAIAKTGYLPLSMPVLVAELFEQVLLKASQIVDPFEQSFFILVHIAYLQPFEDVNKRVSRLAANIPFIKHNLSPLSFVDVPEQAYIDSMLGVYELNNLDLIRELFVWAYERSAARYSIIKGSVTEPDLFRMKYRDQIKTLVANIVRSMFTKAQATPFILRWATEHILEVDRPRFIEIVETELLELHEGNFARYRLRPSEFQNWYKSW